MTLKAIEKWQQTARPDASEKDVSLALGIFLEEVAEVLAEFRQGAGGDDYLRLHVLYRALACYSHQLKTGKTQVVVNSRANLTKS